MKHCEVRDCGEISYRGERFCREHTIAFVKYHGSPVAVRELLKEMEGRL